jgi:hypothetical protein
VKENVAIPIGLGLLAFVLIVVDGLLPLSVAVESPTRRVSGRVRPWSRGVRAALLRRLAMKSHRIAMFAGAAWLGFAAPLAAQITSYSDFPTYAAAVGPHAVVTFTEVPVGTFVTNHYAAQSLQFTDGADEVISNPAFPNDGIGIDAHGRIDVTFSTPRFHVGCDFPGAMTLDLYDGGVLLGSSLDFAGMGQGFFGGVTSVQSFTRVVIRDWFDDAVYIDDLHFGSGSITSNFCTAGTTSHGCVPAIAGTGTPSASASSGFTISVAGVEGQRLGLFFYGISGQQALPWGSGGTSLLCLKAPVQRMTPQSTGGTANACDGALGQDWHAYMTAQPGALGNPRSAGQVFDAQGWFRDPPAVKTTNLTDGLHFVLAP